MGAALLWAVKLVYGNRSGCSDDILKRVLLLAGWILLVLGVVVGFALFSFVIPLPILGLVIVVAAYRKYMAGERRALLWALAVAAEKGIPLEQAARAFADERSVQIGARVSHLADFLESGVSAAGGSRVKPQCLAVGCLAGGASRRRNGPNGPGPADVDGVQRALRSLDADDHGGILLHRRPPGGRFVHSDVRHAQDRARVLQDVPGVRIGTSTHAPSS